MGKRIERIFTENILEKLPVLADKQLTIILKSDLALKGRLVSYQGSNLNVKLNANRIKIISIDLIRELQIDKATDW